MEFIISFLCFHTLRVEHKRLLVKITFKVTKEDVNKKIEELEML